MEQKNKKLLLKDLCARLPYGVFMTNKRHTETHYQLHDYDLVYVEEFGDIPYLRPMSSMTEEEKEELVDLGLAYWDNGKYTDENGNTIIYGGKKIQLIPDIETYDWLNKHYFDYRGLIEKGLAIEVSEDNNPYKGD